MTSRFVRPETDTLTLANGDTLVVRRRLTYGEQQAGFARLYIPGLDGVLKVNPLRTGVALITTYLVDWSLKDDDGKPVPIRNAPVEVVEAALNAQSPESVAEIRAAIEAHEAKMVAEREQEKNDQAGASDSPATSQSAG